MHARGATAARGLALAVVVIASAVAAAAVAADAASFEGGLRAASALRDPGTPSPERASAGGVLYAERCAVCHGTAGRGDGPAASALDPRPANLQLHVPQHTDGELYYFISVGVPGSAMPAWRATLSSEQRWSLVRYLRELAGH